MITLSDITPSVPCRLAGRGEGLDVLIGGQSVSEGPVASDVWSMAGWTIQFVKLGAGQGLGLDQSQGKIYVKIITGAIANTGQNRFADRKQARDTRVLDDHIEAAGDGAILTILTETPSVPDNIHSMDELTVSGPHQDILFWTRFDQSSLAKGVDYFKGLDAHLLPGFHLLDEDGTEILYVHVWTAGKGVDMSPHDHSHRPSEKFPAFTETHWVFNNATGKGGMYDCVGEDLSERTHMSMRRGYDHGPFWAVDADTGMPKQRENGAIEYGFHGWQAGADGDDRQAYDVVAAFEMNPAYSEV